MQTDKTFSIIITTYNIEEYVRQAIDSAINQTYPPFEIIVIDDGSSDSTVEIATQTLKTIHNSQVIKQGNSGPGGARNRGIHAAKGDYLVFLDGDDWLLANTLHLFSAQLDCVPDAIFSNRILFHEKNNNFRHDIVFTKNTQGKVAVGRELLRRFAIHGKAFNRDFLIKNKIFFPQQMIWEDYPFSYSILGSADRINVTTEVSYVFRKRYNKNTSMTQKKRLGTFFLQSRFKQIDMDLEIIFNSKLPAVFKNFNFYRMEFESRLMKDVFYLAKEPPSGTTTSAFQQLKKFLSDNQSIVFNNVSLAAQNVYQAILDDDVPKTIRHIDEYKKTRM